MADDTIPFGLHSVCQRRTSLLFGGSSVDLRENVHQLQFGVINGNQNKLFIPSAKYILSPHAIICKKDGPVKMHASPHNGTTIKSHSSFYNYQTYQGLLLFKELS